MIDSTRSVCYTLCTNSNSTRKIRIVQFAAVHNLNSEKLTVQRIHNLSGKKMTVQKIHNLNDKKMTTQRMNNLNDKKMTTQRQKRKKSEQQRRRLARQLGIWATVCIVAAFLLGCICGMKISAHLYKVKSEATVYSTDNEAASANDNIAGGMVSRQSDTDVTADKTPAEIAAKLNDVADVTVSSPVDYSYSEAVTVLSRMADSDNRYQTIVNHAGEYPQKLLINLANNPEMLSFVAEYEELSAESMTVSLTEDELAVRCPLFLQWDKRWGAHSYGDESNIAVSGCGPTALAMAIVTLTGNAGATPDTVADFAMNEGYYMYGTGTRWDLMTDGAASYGLDSAQLDDMDEQVIKSCLDNGGLVICSMCEGDFTTGGHFVILYDYDEGFLLNDPFCLSRSKRTWTYETLTGQIKAAWAVYAKG